MYLFLRAWRTEEAAVNIHALVDGIAETGCWVVGNEYSATFAASVDGDDLIAKEHTSKSYSMSKSEFREVARDLRPDWSDEYFERVWEMMFRTQAARKIAYEHLN